MRTAFLFVSMEHIEHLGIAVRNLNQAIPIYEKLLNAKCYRQEEVASENVITAFFQTSNNKIELLQATSPDSVIATFIEKTWRGIASCSLCSIKYREGNEAIERRGLSASKR